jgi:small subunit ribosomal protein S20
MAHHKSSLKRIKQTKKKNYYNRTNKKLVKKALRAVREAKTYEEASENLKGAFSILDKVTYRGVIHKNTAANRKSSLAKFVEKLKVVA